MSLQTDLRLLNEAGASLIGSLVEPELSVTGARGKSAIGVRRPFEREAFGLVLELGNLCVAEHFFGLWLLGDFLRLLKFVEGWRDVVDSNLSFFVPGRNDGTSVHASDSVDCTPVRNDFISNYGLTHTV